MSRIRVGDRWKTESSLMSCITLFDSEKDTLLSFVLIFSLGVFQEWGGGPSLGTEVFGGR